MGQGDCTMVSLPNGKTMMVDCGTSRWDTDFNTGVNRNKTKDAATKGFVKILEGTKGAGKPCNVYILASNVQKYDNVNDQDTRVFNRGSVVTLIVYGSQKFMICGDATTNTEKFILAQYNA